MCGEQIEKINKFIQHYDKKRKIKWLGNGKTSEKIIKILSKI